jgi:hypothetical protein
VKYSQAATTKPTPQKMSTMLEFFNRRLTSHSSVIRPNIAASPIA